MNLRLRLAIEWLVIGLLASTIVGFAHFWRGTESFDSLFYDQLSAVSRPAADKDILLIRIDDPSLKAIGIWPWPRNTHARLIEKLQVAKPRSITLDVLLSEAGETAGDDALAAAMQGGPAPVLMPLHFSSPGENGLAYDTIMPAAPFAKAARGIGHVNLAFDGDGTVRRAALCFDPEENGTRWPHLMELAYRTAKNTRIPSPAYQREQCGDTLLIPYAKRGSFTEVSYVDLLEGELPAALIKDHDIIIGATATGMRDNFPVPFGDGGLLSGMEIMANMLSALKQDNFIRPAPVTLVVIISLLPMWLLMIGFLRWRPRTALMVSLGLVMLILLASAGALMARFWFPPGAALVGILLVYPLWGWRRLQAMSDFMASELGALEQEGEASPLPVRASRATDLVGRQSEALAGAIDHMRDLRRFVADTLADLPDPMFVTDPGGYVTLSNDLLNERLGKSIVGLPLGQALDNIVAPDFRAAVERYLQSAPQTGETSSEFVRFISPRDRTFVMRRAAVESDKGDLRGYIYYLADISALASAEAEREQVLQLLSHDMRAPQSAIIALLEGEIDKDARKRIERNARRTMQLAQDFVDLARMGETEFDGEDILLADLIRDVADNFWPLAKERGITITVNDKSDAGFVKAEPDSLSRAFANLIDNAIKFSPDNGNITVVVARSKTFLTIAICDQGKGLDAEILPRLFTRFATSDNQKGRAKGTGLGLTFVMAVVERHRGSITAKNGANGGCCFEMALPEAVED
jgi:CHASE2 domain-containing sensor protein/signal transduction histidine kinase